MDLTVLVIFFSLHLGMASIIPVSEYDNYEEVDDRPPAIIMCCHETCEDCSSDEPKEEKKKSRPSREEFDEFDRWLLDNPSESD